MRLVPSTVGVDVAVHDLGGDGAPLLFAHATGFHGHVWLPLAQALGDAFHCFALDERGHGDSVTPAGIEFDWHGFADDVLAALDGLTLPAGGTFGAGHSAGAAALLMAEAARPGTFRALWCFEPIIFPADPPIGPQDNPLSAGALRRREVFASRDEAYENYAGKPPFSVLRPDALRAYVDFGFDDLDDGTVRLKCRREDESAVYRMGSAHRAFQQLPDVRCPVTLACGADTDAIGPSLLELLAARLPDVRTEVLPNLGHFAPLQDPDACAASIRTAFAPSLSS